MLEKLDSYTLEVTGKIAGRVELFDKIVVWFFTLPTIKLLPIVACLWLLWFSKKNPEKSRIAVIYASLGGLIALAIARIIQNVGPPKSRPLHTNNPDYVMPYGVEADKLKDWSSFPSDHASLALALATGIFYGSRPLGVFCFFWAIVIVCLPRVYAGYHYMSDVLIGGLIGVASFFILKVSDPWMQKLSHVIGIIEQRYTPAFYALAMMASFEIVMMMKDIRLSAEAFSSMIGNW